MTETPQPPEGEQQPQRPAQYPPPPPPQQPQYPPPPPQQPQYPPPPPQQAQPQYPSQTPPQHPQPQPQYPSQAPPPPPPQPGAQVPAAQYPSQPQYPPGQYPPGQYPPGQYPPPGGYQLPAPKQPSSSHRGCWISAIVVIAVILIGAVSCTAIVLRAGKKVSDTVNQEHTVVYSVTGSGSADLTYTTDGLAGSSQEVSAALPWSKTITAKGLVLFFSITAQNGADQADPITCTITVDGKEVTTQTASGPGAIATCTGASG